MNFFELFVKLVLVISVIPSYEVFATSNSKLMHMEVDLSNQQSLQRGAKVFVNYCQSCHSANYMRYNRIGEDLDIAEDILKENLIFSEDKVGDVMSISMKKKDSANFFGVTPPDLSPTGCIPICIHSTLMNLDLLALIISRIRIQQCHMFYGNYKVFNNWLILVNVELCIINQHIRIH